MSVGARQRHRELLARTVRELKNRPCMDCKTEFPEHPEVMEFDHVRGKKLYDMSCAIRNRIALNTLLKEIAKCDLVCANCHRIRTVRRKTRSGK